MMQFWGETMAARSSAVILSELSQESVDALAKNSNSNGFKITKYQTDPNLVLLHCYDRIKS
jgi:tRNA G26 N,N-dimethylase Trm1